MALQTSVNKKMGYGIAGELFDNSIKRVDPYIIKQGVAAKATATITATAKPTANDTVTIGSITYKFVASASESDEVTIGASASAAMTNLATKITADTSSVVSASASDAVLTLTAKTAGKSGNGITLSVSNTTDNTVTAFAGGLDASDIPPKVGCAFGHTSTDNEVVPGNPHNKGFAGILISPKQYANANNFEPTMNVIPNSEGQLLSFGRVLVKTSTSAAPGYYVFFDNATGEISAAAANTAQAGKTLIPNAKFILESVSANGIGIIQIGD